MVGFFWQAVRMTLRDGCAGESRFLSLALVMAVSVLSPVSFFIDRMPSGLREEAARLSGAGKGIVSAREFDAVWLNQTKKYELAWTETRVSPTRFYPERKRKP